MQKKNTLFLILTYLLSFSLQAQLDVKIDANYLLFEEAETGYPVLMYNDSSLVKGFDFKKKIKTNFPEGLNKGEFNNYQFQIDAKNYLVDAGCGPVITFKDSLFNRIDNSFRHRNQYYAAPFVHHKKIYLWGGYGLFTFKNILTYYSFESNEWLLAKCENSDIINPSRNVFSIIINDTLFVFGGTTNFVYQNEELRTNHNLYSFDLKTKTWRKGKEIQEGIFEKDIPRIYHRPFQIESSLYYLNSLNQIIEVKPFEDQLNTYLIKDYKAINSIIYHKKEKKVSYVYFDPQNKLKVKSENFSDFKGALISSIPLYKKEKSTMLLEYFLYTILLLFVIILIYRSKKYFKPKKEELVFSNQKQRFSYNNKIINLTQLQVDILKVFYSNDNTYVTLNTLNDIIAKHHDDINYPTLLKRRENVLKELSIELSLVLGIPKKHLFLKRRNNEDKRIKEIKLNIEIATSS